MSERFRAIQSVLACPDDGSALEYYQDFHCRQCRRRFPVLGRVVELLPREPVSLRSGLISEAYRKAYVKLFYQPYVSGTAAAAWGAPEHVPPLWARRRLRQVRQALPLLITGAGSSESILCDFSGGAGYYTTAYVRAFRYVFHCDLSVESLSYAARKAEELDIENIMFFRIDYFRPPFRSALDRIICFDTLIRGEAHEQLLLKSIARALKPNGLAVVDFHHWWHNPIRQLGLLKPRLGDNRSYSRREAETLLRQAGITDWTYTPFRQEFDHDSLAARFMAKLIPPTRLMYRFSGSDADDGGSE